MLTRPAVDRRRVLGLGLMGAAALLTGCTTATTPDTSTGNTGTGNTGTTGTSSCAALPTETQGPYPADGSSASGQTLNILDDSGIVRSKLTTSFGTGNTVDGVPLTLTMTLANTNSSCAALSGYVIYVWHCTPAGKYSLYDLPSEDYLRGVQVTDSNGQVTFTTIFPGCYAGRWPHIHFEVYASLADAATGNVNKNVKLVSQIAMPEANCRAVYADSRYGSSLTNLNNISLSRDNVFSDGYSTQMATVTGSNSAGYAASIVVGLSV